jgi:diamine N-acetyltransferase
MDARTVKWAKEQLQTRAAEKPEFRAQLLADARGAINAEFGFELPAEMEVEVLEETAHRFYVVLSPLPPGKDAVVTLREITSDNVRTVCALEVAPEQRNFVAPNATSIAEGSVSPKAWYRAIYADETPVGFVMLLDDPDEPRYYLWRYMVAQEHQGRGFGRQALQQVVEYVRTRPGATYFELSYVPGEGSPRDFYARLGFEDTGEQHGGEQVMRLVL